MPSSVFSVSARPNKPTEADQTYLSANQPIQSRPLLRLHPRNEPPPKLRWRHRSGADLPYTNIFIFQPRSHRSSRTPFTLNSFLAFQIIDNPLLRVAQNHIRFLHKPELFVGRLNQMRGLFVWMET
jgi:hypothetical protein